MSNKQKNVKLWRKIGIAVIALVVLAGIVVGSYTLGVRTGGDLADDGMWMHRSERFEDYSGEDGAAVPYNGRNSMPMYNQGRMFPGTAFFSIGRFLGGLLFLGLIFAAIRMIFFPRWRHPRFAGPFPPHHPYYYPEGYDRGNNNPEPQAENPEVTDDEN